MVLSVIIGYAEYIDSETKTFDIKLYSRNLKSYYLNRKILKIWAIDWGELYFLLSIIKSDKKLSKTAIKAWEGDDSRTHIDLLSY